MPIVRMDVQPLVVERSADLRMQLEKKIAGDDPLPHLRAVTTDPGNAAIRSYRARLRQTGTAIGQGLQLGGHELFRADDFPGEDALRNEIERLSYVPGLGVLALRPFGIERSAVSDEGKKRAARIAADTLAAIPPQQNIDGQGNTEHFQPATALTSVRLLDYGLQRRGDKDHPEQNTDITNTDLRLAVIGEGPAVGRPVVEILESLGHTPLVITRERGNTDKLDKLWLFDGVISAAGSPFATELIKPGYLERPFNHRDRPAMVIADAAFDRSPLDGTPQGNLHRDFAERPGRLSDRINTLYTPLGAIGASTGVEIFDAAWRVWDVQQDSLALAR